MKVCSCECIKSFVDNADVEKLGSPLSRGLPAKGKNNYIFIQENDCTYILSCTALQTSHNNLATV